MCGGSATFSETAAPGDTVTTEGRAWFKQNHTSVLCIPYFLFFKTRLLQTCFTVKTIFNGMTYVSGQQVPASALSKHRKPQGHTITLGKNFVCCEEDCASLEQCSFTKHTQKNPEEQFRQLSLEIDNWLSAFRTPNVVIADIRMEPPATTTGPSTRNQSLVARTPCWHLASMLCPRSLLWIGCQTKKLSGTPMSSVSTWCPCLMIGSRLAHFLGVAALECFGRHTLGTLSSFPATVFQVFQKKILFEL